MKHHPTLLRASCRDRIAWCECACGWKSGDYHTVVGAHLAFGRHLLDTEAS